MNDIPALLKLPLALAFVIGLILLVAYLVRRFGPFSGALPSRHAAKRLGLVASQVIDNKRRLVLVRRDGVEHLLLVGGPNDLVVEHGIIPPAAAEKPDVPPAPEPQAGDTASPGHRTEPTL